MKRRLLKKMFIILFAVFIPISGCSITALLGGNGLVKMNMISEGTQIGFNLPLIYPSSENVKLSDISFVRFEGENIEGLHIEIVDDNFDFLKDFTYKDYSMLLLGVRFKYLNDKPGVVNEAVFNVNGKEMNVRFNSPLRFQKFNGEDSFFLTEEVSEGVIPAVVMPGDLKGVYCSYNINKPIVIDGFLLADYFDITISQVVVNGVECGTIEEAFPLEVESGSRLSITFDATAKDLPDYVWIYNNIILKYHTISGLEKAKLNTIVRQGIANLNDTKATINLILGID